MEVSERGVRIMSVTSAIPLRRLKVVSWGTACCVRGTTAADMYGLSVEVSGERFGGERKTWPYSDPFLSVERGRETFTSLSEQTLPVTLWCDEWYLDTVSPRCRPPCLHNNSIFSFCTSCLVDAYTHNCSREETPVIICRPLCSADL